MQKFEIRHRDGLARIIILRRNGREIVLPAALETPELFPSLGTRRYSNIPLSAPAEFVKTYGNEKTGEPYAVHPAGLFTVPGGEVAIVPGWHTALENPELYVDWLITLKERVPPDTAWYAPGAALPSTVHLLCYSGFDLFDFTGVDLLSVRGKFCLPEGIFGPELMETGVCSCRGCDGGDLSLHNRETLIREIALLRSFIRSGRLRELVESRCRVQPEQVAVLRRFDCEEDFCDQRWPVVRSVPMGATNTEDLHRIEIRRFASRVVARYTPPTADVAVLLPCSVRKPYSLSKSHRIFSQVIGERAHELIVTSPVGLVPRELELMYPAAHYDVPVTGYWDREEKAFISGVIAAYFGRHRYRRVIAHLEGGALEVAEEAARAVGIDLERTCSGHPLSGESLRLLGESLSGERRVRHDILGATISWQFGAQIETRGISRRGRYPELFYSRNRTQLFSLDTSTGLVRPTFEGWDLLPDRYRIGIEDFIPTGDVLVPGVTACDAAIRAGDDVLVVGPSALATGRAAMGADEMKRSSCGVAVRVRKVKRLGG
ncbi:MAG: archaeosine synthase subunit alpha [Methanomicrobiales archaeon]|nr:archaeosine synthase subunit alpha [Methanomicrobiales archaeon]